MERLELAKMLKENWKKWRDVDDEGGDLEEGDG